REYLGPNDLTTAETFAFLGSHLPGPPARVLEVGCGDGTLAAVLQHKGYQVVAIDASADAVAMARKKGVDASVAKWPDFTDSPFAAILFTRSLHHNHPLDKAVERARELLPDDGVLLVEDFAFEEVDPPAVEWLYHVLVLLNAGGLLRLESD